MPDPLPLDWFLLVLRVLFIFLLYFFLYQLIRVTTRELIALAGTMPEARGRREAGQLPDRLVLIDPGDSLLYPGTVFALQPFSLVGRLPECTVSLDEPFVSGEHAELTLRHGRWWVHDLGSTNGTFVNGSEVTVPTSVEVEDVVQFGRVKLRLVR
jgi:hypothetical protein